MQGHGRDGGFDTLRLLAALAVFHSHSFALAGYPEPRVPGFTVGSAAVIVFFALSGYWVSRSALERSLPAFAVARALRIVPGLFVCGFVTIGLCALATSLVVNDYLRDPQTWSFLRNSLPFFIPQQTLLPGVFEDGAYHHANGSLWTLPYEVLCYLLVGFAALFGARGVRLAMGGAAILAGVVLLDPSAQGWLQLIGQLDRRWLAIFLAAFFLGAALNAASTRDLGRLAIGAGLAVLAARKDPAAVALASIGFWSCLAIWAGRRLDLDRVVTRGRDLSYGFYIYAWPCEQLAARALTPHDPASYLAYYALALLATLALAALSWTLVERPALNAKGRVAGVIERGVGRLPLGAIRLWPDPRA